MRNAGIDQQFVALYAQSEHPFQRYAIYPTRRSRVPCPAAAPSVRRHGIDVRADDIRLHAITMHCIWIVGVTDRIEHGQQLDRLFAVALHRKRERRPRRGMRILSTVLTDAR